MLQSSALLRNCSDPGRRAEYRDERVCLSVSVCLSVRDHIFGNYMSDLQHFFSGGVVICNVLPALWMASYLPWRDVTIFRVFQVRYKN